MGNNNLYKVENTLRSIAKRYKSVKYSLGLAILFLMMGVSAFSEEVVAQEAVAQQEVMTTEQIATSKENLRNSVGSLQSKIDAARAENEKGLAGLRLELIQLMEQGDQVVKSPWSSWQFGANYMYNKWNGTYKGKGDKAQKYPFEGIFVRETGANEFNRYVSENSSMYSYLSKSNNGASASSSLRGNTNDYGLASNTTVPENPVSFAISASIKPRIVTKGAIIVPAPAALSPTLPRAIDFKPVTPKIEAPEAPNVTTPNISAPATGNGDSSWIYNETTALKLDNEAWYSASGGGSSNVGVIAQQDMDGGKLTVTGNGSNFTVNAKNITFTGRWGANHNKSNANSGILDFTVNSTGFLAAMKLVGGHQITVNSEIEHTGTGTAAYNRWLFHTDGHNDNGASTWIIKNKINMTGTNLVLYTSQYHSGTGVHANIGFVNDGNINISGTKNIGWIALKEHGDTSRVQYFHNRAGSMTLSGDSNIFAYIMAPVAGSFNITNDADLKLSGNKQFGIVVNDTAYGVTPPAIAEFDKAEIFLNKEMEIEGSESVGTVFKGWAKIEGGEASFSQSGADNEVTPMNATSKESIFKYKLGGTKNIGMYFGYSGTKAFNVKDLVITSTGDSNTGIFAADGIVNISDKNTPAPGGTARDNTITMSGKKSIGIFAAAAGDTLSSGAKVTLTGDSSTGIFAKSSGAVTNTGEISASGKSVKAMIAQAATITSTGKITVNGTALSDTDGSVGLASMNGGNLTQNNANTNITVDGSASIGAYADGKVGVPHQ